MFISNNPRVLFPHTALTCALCASQLPPARESAAINSSLMTLGRCLEALKFNQARAPGVAPRIIPVRESSITHLFKEVLLGQGNLVLSVHVSGGRSGRVHVGGGEHAGLCDTLHF